LAALRLRDRDAIITKENLIFRVFGYSHPSNAYVCDAEYAPSAIFKSTDPRALRSNGQQVFYKFYEDEGWKFVQNGFPQYMIFHEMLRRKVVGVDHTQAAVVRKPNQKLAELIEKEPKDELIAALQKALQFTIEHSGLSVNNFGVFGSILHGFHHPKFSDLDFTVYGRRKIFKLRESLLELYKDKSSLLRNEFETEEPIKGKNWKYKNYSPKEYLWHQRRKLIYALFKDEKSGKVIKTEFEPVKNYNEISNEYDSKTEIVQKGWTKMFARVVEDKDAPFIPSVYRIEPLEILNGQKSADKVKRIVSYMEEFRMQAWTSEVIYVEGNLEEVTTSEENFHQIALTYCPRYYEQVLKVASQK
jgi:predicted nucleotidyltransferase